MQLKASELLKMTPDQMGLHFDTYLNEADAV